MNEWRLSGSLGINKGAAEAFTRRMVNTLFNQTGDGFVHQKQNIGDVAETLDMGSVTSAGPFLFINHSTLYSVFIGQAADSAGGQWFLEIPAGGFVLGYGLACNAPYALASDSTGVELEYFIGQR